MRKKTNTERRGRLWAAAALLASVTLLFIGTSSALGSGLNVAFNFETSDQFSTGWQAGACNAPAQSAQTA